LAVKDRKGVVVGVSTFLLDPTLDVGSFLASLLVDSVSGLEEH
jgi:hypothetical protein